MQKQKLNKRRFLGDLCDHGHRHVCEEIASKENPGEVLEISLNQSVRYKKCKTCCTCNALSVLDRKGEHEKYRHEPYNKKKMNKYQIYYRINYRSKNKKVKS